MAVCQEPQNPATSIESLPNEKPGKTPFTQQQIEKLSTVSPPEWKLAMLFGYCTRLRIGDIANMTWNAVDLEKSSIKIVPKKIREYQEGGFIPIHAQLKDTLIDVTGQDDPEAPILPALAGRQTGGKLGLSKTFDGLNGEARYRPPTLPQGRRQRANHEPVFIPFFTAQFQHHAREQGDLPVRSNN